MGEIKVQPLTYRRLKAFFGVGADTDWSLKVQDFAQAQHMEFDYRRKYADACDEFSSYPTFWIYVFGKFVFFVSSFLSEKNCRGH